MKISIITASYNCEEFIGKTIKSVLTQSYTDWELIIVDDGSNDNSIEIINNYISDKVKIYQHECKKNKGLKETIQLALTKAKGDYIAFLDCDDYWDNDYLLKKIEILKQNNDIKFICNDVEIFGDKQLVNEYENYRFKYNSSWYKDVSDNLLYSNILPSLSAIMLKKSIIINCDFNTPIDAFLDWWLWAQVLKNNKVYYLHERLTYWRRHKNSYMRTSNEINSKRQIFQKKLIKLYSSKKRFKTQFLIFIIKLSMNKRVEKIFRKSFNKIFKTLLTV